MSDSRGKPWARRLRVERARRCWTRGDLAYRMTMAARGLGISDLPDWMMIRNYTHSWEAGDAVPDWRYQLLLSSVYGLGVQDLFGSATVLDIGRELLCAAGGTVDVPHFARAEDDRMQRRAFVAWLGALAAGTAAMPKPVRQMVESANEQPDLLPVITTDDVAQLDDANAMFTEWEYTVGGSVARRAIAAHLYWAVAQLENGVPGTPEALDAWRVTTARLAQTAGWCCHDAQREPQARALLIQGYQVASTVEQPTLAESSQAFLLGQLAHQAADIGRPRTALALVQQGQSMASAVSPTVRYRLHAMEARAHAGIGDQRAMHQALGRAEDEVARMSIDDLHITPWDENWQQAGTRHLNTANALTDLIRANPDAATPELVRRAAAEYAASSAGLTSRHRRNRTSAQLRAATALFIGRDLDRAVETAREALPALPGLRSQRIREDARDLRKSAGSFHRRADVREMVNELDAALA